VKAGEQKSKLKKAYNITVEEWSEMITKQGSKCLICRQEFDRSHRSTTPYVDHAHDATQHVRGILCQLCNLGLGAFHDNVTTLANAIQYLTKFKETQNSCQNARNTSYAQNQPEPILGAWVKPSYQELYFSLPETTA
jgi:hypothetical protein